MKVSITLSVDVDVDAWDLAYGTGTKAKAVREDVRQYVLALVQNSAAADESEILSARLGMATGAAPMMPRA